MRHQNHKYRVGTSSSHRKSLMRNLAGDVISHGKIQTTHIKCKAVQIYLERLITIAKVDSVANRRLVQSRLHSKDAVHKLFVEVAPKFKERPGGYTRILKLAEGRIGDGAKMSYLALVD